MLGKFKDFFSGYAATGKIEYLCVGLGNPGRDYEHTRHNMGYLAVDFIAKARGFEVGRLKFKSLCGDVMLEGKRVLFLKPSTYMNRSGQAVVDAMSFYKIPPENLIVISDDVALAAGKMRIRRGGSDGGQKGLNNIIYLTGRDDFPRIRLGIGKKPHADMELADWVLSRFTPQELKALEPVFQNTLSAVELIVSGKIDEAMNKYN